LDGMQLTPVAHRGELRPRTAEKVFHTRVEGSFRRIIRHGADPAAYWWEVTDKKGVRHFYGGTPEKGLQPEAVLADEKGSIFKWALVQVRDTNGNTIDYSYTKVFDSGTGDGSSGPMGVQLYLKTIRYTGRTGEPGPYRVDFIRDRERQEPRRLDVSIDCRPGFKLVTADLLRRIEVRLGDDLVRAYELIYRTGAFRKTLLAAIVQYGADGREFNRHTFTYYDEISEGEDCRGFNPPVDWNTGYDRIGLGLLGLVEATALGSSTSDTVGGHLYTGVNPKGFTKAGSAGFKAGYSYTTSKGAVALIDLDGDGLPDKVFEQNGTYYYRKNRSGPGGGTDFGPPVPLPTLTGISLDRSETVSAGAEGYIGASLMANTSTTFTTSTVYFSDVNGDGLPDLVNNGNVYYNHLENGVPTFTLNDSGRTPVPISAGSVDAGGLTRDFSGEYQKMLEAFPLMDAVLCWEAPYDGRISVHAPVRLAGEARGGYATADGVRVAVQHNAVELWAARIEADDHGTYTPTGLSSLAVKKGDRLYFRVQSVFDGAFDQVEWDPEIVYIDFPAAQDANGLNPTRFKVSEDFIYAGRGGEIEAPLTGTIRLRGDLEKKGITSDDLRLLVYRNGEVVIERSLRWDATGRIALDDELSVQKSDKLRFYIEADSPVDWRQVEWTPEVYYTAVEGAEIPVVDQSGNPTISLRAVYDVDLYGKNDLRAPQEAWEAPKDGAILVWPELSLSSSAVLNDGVVFTVKRPRERLAKTVIPIIDGKIRPVPPLQMRVGKGERLFFDFSTRLRDLAEQITQKRVTVYYLEEIAAPGFWEADDDGRVIVSPELALNEAAIGEGLAGRMVFRVKRGPAVVGEIEVSIDDGLVRPVFPMEIEVVRGERLQFEFDGLEEMENYITFQGALVGYKKRGLSVPNCLHGPAVANLLPAAYRGWGYFAYNGNGDRALRPIEEKDLVIGDDYNPGQAKVYIMYPQPEKARWGSEDEQCWIAAGTISSSRRGMDYIAIPGTGPAGGGRGINRVSSATQNAFSAGFSFATVSTSEGTSAGELDFMDMNGDRYPDIVGPGRIQYTTMTGGLEERNRAVPGFSGPIRQNTNRATNGGVAGNPAVMIPNSRGDVVGTTVGVIRGLMSPLGVTLNLFGEGKSEADWDLVDINGDGLPDRVAQDGAEILVALNRGYGFAPAESWGSGKISEGTSKNEPLELGLGFNFGDYSFAGGISYSTSRSQEERGLMDMNGDGLVDLVIKTDAELYVAVNTGGGFAPAVAWKGAPVDKHLSDTANVNLGAGAYFTVSIWIPFTTAFVIINPGVDAGRSIGNRESAVMDINGDGYVDYVSSNNDGHLGVALNRTGLTNKLKSIERPLGARIELDYARDGNTYDLPYSKWVLRQTVIYDGHSGDGVDTQVITYRYEKGRYDRLEREFYGYGVVATEFRDPDDGYKVYKTLTVTYRNDSYYTKGLVESESISDGAGRPYNKTVYQYCLLDVETQREFFDIFPYNTAATVFPQLILMEKYFYEGQENPGVYTYSTYEYDQYGNVVRYFEAGDAGADDDVEAVIEYYYDLDHYIVEKPSRLKVYGHGVLMRYREGSYEEGTGNLVELRQFLEDGRAQVTNLEYYPDGNLRRVTGPPNANGERYTVEFTYDDVVGIYLTRVTDSFGYSSTADYDFRFGVEISSIDINGNRMRREYDQFGRPVKIFSPYDQDIPAVAFAYYPEETPARAVTRNKIYFDPTNDETLDMVVFIDGLKRVIQTKKEGEVLPEGATEPVYGMTVSGKVLFDAMGRIAAQGQPVFQPGYSMDFYAEIPLNNPTENRYDILDRTTEVILPDGSRIGTVYSLADGLFKITVTDPEGKIRHNYQDVQGNTVRVEQFNQGKKITTAYEYNPLNEIVKIVDDQKNITVMTYDLLGRRTSIKTPDAGLVEYVYDLAGNLIRKVDGNLRAKGRAIEYRYEYNRLIRIDYPFSRDVEYIYGRPGDAHNRAGRLYKVVDGSGVTESYYGKLGEEIKTVKIMNLPAPGPWPWVFVSEQGFDYLGRVQWMTYPDGEKLVYEYDRGGQVKSVYGIKYWDRFDYVKQIGYDEFGQRVYIKYGNDVETRYTYDPYRRWLLRLETQNRWGENFQDLNYTFDRAGNILVIENTAREIRQEFRYDDLYQLIRAEGVARKKGWTNRYVQTFAYDTIGNIIEKTSLNQIAPGNHRPKELNYEFTYVYETSRPHAPSRIGEWLYFYDENGNTVRKERRKDEWPHHHFPGCGRCDEYSWDEENRLIQAEVGGKTTYFLYDAAGERRLKRGPHGETVYVSEYFQLQNRQQATKHVFV
ncbi:MAG: hypothetical protein GX493_11235, partial [Firmicutes bacterium]|nr:hypothetical protein [Bacillota bacterium]